MTDATPSTVPQLQERLGKIIAEYDSWAHRDTVAAEQIIRELQEGGWIIPGVPPVIQVLADARQFSDELVLTKLVARFFRVNILAAVVLPETPAVMDWLRDYIDGTHQVHGPLGKPMIWPERLVSTCKMLRSWGFQPTPTIPAYVSLKPGGAMAPLDLPDPEVTDPRSVKPMHPEMEERMSALLDDLTGGVAVSAVNRGVALRAMLAAYELGRRGDA